MGKLRYDCYEDFSKQIEFPVVVCDADTGTVRVMNYEAKLILGQKMQTLTISLEKIADAGRFFSRLHDRKAVVEHHLILSNGTKEFPVAGLVNEFEVDGQRMYFLLFDQRSGFGMNAWLLERMIENSHVVLAHMTFEDQQEMKLNYISRNVNRYGYTCEEFYTGKRKFRDLVHPDDLDLVLGSFAKRMKDGRTDDSLEYRIVTESRKVCYVRCNVHFNRNELGKIESMEAVMIDVTGEKLEKDENQYLRAAIEQSHHVVLVKRYLNRKGTVKYISANAVGIGMNVEDLRKGRKSFTDYIVPEDRQMMTDILMNAQSMPVTNHTDKCRIRGEDGKIRWIRFCISVKTIDEYMYDVELLLSDVTEENQYEESILQNQKELEEKLDYVMNGEVQDTEKIVEEFLEKEEVQGFMEAFSSNNQLYAVVVNVDSKRLSRPTGPMIHLGEFYDILENPKYRDRIRKLLQTIEERKKYYVLELEENNFERQIGAVPLIVDDHMVAACLICTFDDEAVARLHNSIESLQKMIELVVKAGFSNRYLEMDSRKSRLAERTMSEELEGQLILAKAFANMRSDAHATVQEIIDRARELLHLTSIVVYYGDSSQEAYTCMAKAVAPDAEFQEYPEQSWRLAQICRQNDLLMDEGYLVYGENPVSGQMAYLVNKSASKDMMLFALVVNGELCGSMTFASQEKRNFLDREIAYCQDVVDIIQGILVRKQNTSNVYALYHNLLNAYNYMKECVFIKEVQTGKVLFANEAMETLFGMDVTGMDSRSFLSEPTPTYTREGIQPVRDIKWQSYIRRVNKIMNIQELSVDWEDGREAKIVIMRENQSGK